MDAKKIVIDAQATLGPPPYWLCEVKEDREFKDNRPTDKLLGYKYLTAIPALSLERIAVKIPGPQQIVLPDGELEGVSFENLTLGVYANDKRQIILTARATGISVVPEKT